jgi:DNA-binding transcriptional LysR family regulator
MLQGRQVEAFRAVMLTGSMTAAAEMMHVTQPAISRLIRDFEAALKLKLFYRNGNTISPTTEASDLFAEVERSFVGLERLRDRAENLRSGRSGSLTIAALPAMVTRFLPRFVASFCRMRPGVKVLIDGIPSHLVLERVECGQFDIGLTAMAVERSSLNATKIAFGAVAVMPAGHRLAAKHIVYPEDILDENLIMISNRYGHQQAIELALQAIHHRQVIETPLSYVACGLVSEGMGLAVVDPFSASDFVGRGVAIRPFDSKYVIEYSMIHANMRPQSLLAREFGAAFLEHVQSFLDGQEYLSPLSSPKREFAARDNQTLAAR